MIDNEPDPLRRIPVKHAAEIRAEIGSVLREARTKRGVSLETVAQQTRISKRYLEAMENDRFGEFPAIVYLRGFLKGYCEYLEVDFAELWSKIEVPSPEEAAAQTAASATATASVPASRAATTRPPAAHSRNASQAEADASSSSGSMFLILFCVAAAIGLGIWLASDRKLPEISSPETTPKALMPMPRTVEPTISLRAVDDAWVQASVDAAVVFEGRVPRGTAMEWKPAKSVSLRTTSSEAIRVSVNGAPTPLPAPLPDGSYRFDVQ